MRTVISPTSNSFLDEIRSTIASFESLRTARTNISEDNCGPSLALAPLNAVGQLGQMQINLAERAELTVESTCAVQAFPDTANLETVPHPNSKKSGAQTLNLEDIYQIHDSIPFIPSRFAATTQPSELSNLGEKFTNIRCHDKTAKIMLVDADPVNILEYRRHLKIEGYENFVTTSDAREALHLIRQELPDVLLLDIQMPKISGLDLLRVIGLDPILQHIPVLMLTTTADLVTRKQALDLGASDFLQKPIAPEELVPRVRNAIVIKKHYDMASSETLRLEKEVKRRTHQLEATRQQLVLCLARAAEQRDNDTGNHVIRVGRYTAIIARQMGYPENRLEMLEQAAQLHDVGKIGIPDSILFKPGKLGLDEYDLMKKHCALGRQIIEPISEKHWNILKSHASIGGSMLHVQSSSLLMLASRIAQTHHERWDGLGYPLGLHSDDIPVEGRIVAVADVFDALSSKRPYKDPFPRQKCFDILREGRGTQFDPAVIDAFFACGDQIVEIQLLLMDEEDRIHKGHLEPVALTAETTA